MFGLTRDGTQHHLLKPIVAIILLQESSLLIYLETINAKCGNKIIGYIPLMDKKLTRQYTGLAGSDLAVMTHTKQICLSSETSFDILK